MKNKSIILGFVSAVFACNLVFTSCSEPKEVEKFTFLEKRILSGEDSLIDQYVRTKGDAHGGAYFSRTDSTGQYGIGTILTVNDTNLNKDLRINVSLWVRTNTLGSLPGTGMAIAVHDKDNNVPLWHVLDINKQVGVVNQWTLVKDSVTISGSILSKPNMIIKTLMFNSNPKSIVLDGDDLEVTFKTVTKVLEE